MEMSAMEKTGQRTAMTQPNGHLQIGKFTLTATGMAVEGEPTFEEWEQAYSFARRAESGVMWWVGDLLNYGERVYGETYAQAMVATELKYKTLRVAKWVAGQFELSRRRDNLSFEHHRAVASLPPRDREKWLERADKEGLRRAELRTAIHKWKLNQAKEQYPLPSSKYRVIYADPPWKYSDDLAVEGYGVGAVGHYPSMSIEEMAALGIRDLADENAALFLWVTVPILPDAFSLLEAWGFAYKTLFVWDKVAHNYGHYNSVRAELLILATQGSCLPDSKELKDSVVSIPRSSEHSEKPEEFRQIIDELYTDGKRIELFARKRVAGWDAWGNEVAAA
jgi:N6-adenosine-specific RNA methylase IME4